MKPPISIYQFHVIPKISSWILIFDCVFWKQNTIYPTSWYNTRQSLPNNPKANQFTLTGEFFIQSLNDTQEYMVYLKHFLDTCCRYSRFYGVTARSKLFHQEPRILRGTRTIPARNGLGVACHYTLTSTVVSNDSSTFSCPLCSDRNHLVFHQG